MARFTSAAKQITGNIKGASIVARKKEHRDLDLNFTLHPIKKDIVPLRDDRAIQQSLQHILSTNEFERPFNKDFGANLRSILFEPDDPLTRIFLRHEIRTAISRSEPRVDVTGVNIKNIEARDSYLVDVFYIIKEFNIQTNFTIELRRLR